MSARPSPYHRTDRGVLYRATAEEVYPHIETDAVKLLISDGPYGIGKADWDRMGVDGLADWYAPHIAEWDRVCSPSSTVYAWNTAEGWARIDPLIRAAGWTFRALVTWDKGIGFMAGKCDVNGLRTWYDVTEVCGMYQREEWAPSTCAGAEIGYAAGADDRNTARVWLCSEWKEAGLKSKDADRAMGTTDMARHCFSRSQWSLPTWGRYQKLHAHAMQHGRPRERPYLVLPEHWRSPDHLRASYDHLRAEYDHLRAEYDHLRAEYEASRPSFDAPMGLGNVWSHGQVAGAERLRGPDGLALHPCQKPAIFYDRIIRASSRPGELVLEPFGGTCRSAAAIAQMTPPDARRYICIEPDMDGRDYLPAVAEDIKHRRQSVSLLERATMAPEQTSLLEATP
jgi:DNA modification methylase